MKLENNGGSEECDITGSILMSNVKRPRSGTTKIKGIYRITNVNNGKFYIGRSNDILTRWFVHKRDLVSNKHHSIVLQHSFNKHGMDVFIFDLIEKIEIDDYLVEREQHHLDTLMPWKRSIGYNISKISFGSSICFSEHPRKEEIRLKYRERSGGKNNPMFGKHHSKKSKRLIATRSVKFGDRNGRWKNISDDTKQKILNEALRFGQAHAIKFAKTLGVGNKVTLRLLKDVTKEVRNKILESGRNNTIRLTDEWRQNPENFEKIKENVNKAAKVNKTRVGPLNSFFQKKHSKKTKRFLSRSASSYMINLKNDEIRYKEWINNVSEKTKMALDNRKLNNSKN